MSLNRIIISGLQVLQNQQLQQQAVVVEGNKIAAIIPDEMIKHHLPAKQYEFPKNYYLLPGFIDCHIHGLAGHDVMDATKDSLMQIRQSLTKEGVTGFLATTMTTEKEKIENALTNVAACAKEKIGSNILGIHLEGPFIAKTKLGAHSNNTHLPDIKLIKKWQTLSQNLIRKVTLAPELPHALEFITALNEMQIIASLGHSNATYEETQTAITTGCLHATHLFNAMRPFHQRDPGIIGAILLSDQIHAELIVDGIHLHPAIVEMAYRLKGKDHLSLVTDAMRAKCMPDNETEYDLGGQAVIVKDGKATLKDGTIAGSTLTMPQAIKNMMKYTNCTLIDAIQMASHNPARELGQSARKGRIDIGMDADLVVMDTDLNVQLTMVAGRVEWPRL